MTVTTTQALMHAPSGSNYQGFTNVNGRKYATPAGTPLLVNDYDAGPLESAGWTRADTGGTTAARPTGMTMLNKGFKYNDSTVGAMVLWDGKAWRHATTGAAA